MRIGLAGAGRIGAFHASTLAALADVEQIVLTDVFPESAARLGEENGYDLALDLDDLLSRVDAPVITTSTSGGLLYRSGDVDTGAALRTLDDGTLVTVSASRYNGGGHDVRMEIMGSEGTIGVGYDDALAVRSAEADVDYPRGPQKWSFMERFLPAYRTELAALCDVVAGRMDSPCTGADSLEAFRVAEACEISRATGRAVEMNEIGDAT